MIGQIGHTGQIWNCLPRVNAKPIICNSKKYQACEEAKLLFLSFNLLAKDPSPRSPPSSAGRGYNSEVRARHFS